MVLILQETGTYPQASQIFQKFNERIGNLGKIFNANLFIRNSMGHGISKGISDYEYNLLKFNCTPHDQENGILDLAAYKKVQLSIFM